MAQKNNTWEGWGISSAADPTFPWWKGPSPSIIPYEPISAKVAMTPGSSAALSTYPQQIAKLQEEITELREKLTQIEKYIHPDEQPIIQLRDISHARAKKEIVNYFKAHHGENLDQYDISCALNIDMETVFDVFEELTKEGQIREV